MVAARGRVRRRSGGATGRTFRMGRWGQVPPFSAHRIPGRAHRGTCRAEPERIGRCRCGLTCSGDWKVRPWPEVVRALGVAGAAGTPMVGSSREGTAAQHGGWHQRQRVQIPVPATQPPVQTSGLAVERPVVHDAHHLPRGHRVALGHQGPHRLVRRAQGRCAAVGHRDGEHSPPRERHAARCGGPHRLSRARGEVHPAMPGGPRLGRRLPTAEHGGPQRPHRSVHRPGPVGYRAEPSGRRGACGRGRGRRRTRLRGLREGAGRSAGVLGGCLRGAGRRRGLARDRRWVGEQVHRGGGQRAGGGRNRVAQRRDGPSRRRRVLGRGPGWCSRWRARRLARSRGRPRTGSRRRP